MRVECNKTTINIKHANNSYPNRCDIITALSRRTLLVFLVSTRCRRNSPRENTHLERGCWVSTQSKTPHKGNNERLDVVTLWLTSGNHKHNKEDDAYPKCLVLAPRSTVCIFCPKLVYHHDVRKNMSVNDSIK